MHMCSECGAVLLTANGLCSHLKHIHSFNVFSVWKCGQDGCGKEYPIVKSFKRHLEVKHPFPQNIDVDRLESEHGDQDNYLLEHEGSDEEMHENPDVNLLPAAAGPNLNIAPATIAALKNTLFESSLALSAKIYSSPTLNRAQVQEVIDYFSEFSSSGFLDILKSKVMLMLRDTNQTQRDLEDLNSMFLALENSFAGLQTEHLRMSALKSCQFYISPHSYVIGVTEKVRNVEGHAVLTEIALTGQHIPIKNVLKAYFELPGILDATLNNVRNLKASRKFSNIVQSPLWQDIEQTHFENKIVLPLFLYFDDVEPDNQCGSHAGAHKIGAVYYEVPCIPQHLLSSLENIFVALIFLSDDRHRNNGDAFRPLINELRDLESHGILIQTETGEHLVYFCLCLLLGDNLGLHSISGFVESFSANYSCRFCRDHKQVTKSQKRENPDSLRNLGNYEDDLRLDDYSLTGIKSRCIWNVLVSFHICVNFVVDVMYDLLEGVCHYDLGNILNELIYVERYFTLEILNERVQNYDYGPESGNKAPPITRDHIAKPKFKMSASEMLCFVRNLGFMIGDLVPEASEAWKVYKLLVQILDIITMPYVRRDSDVYLATLISEHHEVYCNLFGNSLKPKHHFMVHYPSIMKLIGPLIHVWVMRFEAKHRPVVKQVAKAMTCRKNLPLTLVIEYLLTLSARLLSKRGFPKDINCNGKEHRVIDCYNYVSFSNLLHDNHENLVVVREISVKGTSYHSNLILVVNFEEDLPLFGKLHWIIPHDNVNNIRFIVSIYATICFTEHLHCYEVRPTDEWLVLSYDALVSFYPTFERVGADGNLYVTFRHAL